MEAGSRRSAAAAKLRVAKSLVSSLITLLASSILQPTQAVASNPVSALLMTTGKVGLVIRVCSLQARSGPSQSAWNTALYTSMLLPAEITLYTVSFTSSKGSSVTKPTNWSVVPVKRAEPTTARSPSTPEVSCATPLEKVVISIPENRLAPTSSALEILKPTK